MSSKILVVDDEKEIRNLIEIYLKNEGYTVLKASNGEEALEVLAKEEVQLMILDIMMPKMDGMEVCRRVREHLNIPILMLSAKSEDMDKIAGIMTGADDYLTKPFSISELLARVRVGLRNAFTTNNTIEEKTLFKLRDLEIDYEKRKVFVRGENIHLTPIEYKIIVLMSKYSGRVLTHKFIIKEIWGTYLENETQSLRVFMASIRRKIEKDPAQPEYIITEMGIGYRLVDE